jgi:hypothetical protein
MSEDDINKIETLVGYLQPLYNGLEKKSGWHFLLGVIEEAEDWLIELRSQAKTSSSVRKPKKDTTRESE